MFLRAKYFKRKKDNKARTYYYLVESEKKNKRVKQNVVRYLGNADAINKNYEELDRLRRLNSNKY